MGNVTIGVRDAIQHYSYGSKKLALADYRTTIKCMHTHILAIKIPILPYTLTSIITLREFQLKFKKFHRAHIYIFVRTYVHHV